MLDPNFATQLALNIDDPYKVASLLFRGNNGMTTAQDIQQTFGLSPQQITDYFKPAGMNTQFPVDPQSEMGDQLIRFTPATFEAGQKMIDVGVLDESNWSGLPVGSAANRAATIALAMAPTNVDQAVQILQTQSGLDPSTLHQAITGAHNYVEAQNANATANRQGMQNFVKTGLAAVVGGGLAANALGAGAAADTAIGSSLAPTVAAPTAADFAASDAMAGVLNGTTATVGDLALPTAAATTAGAVTAAPAAVPPPTVPPPVVPPPINPATALTTTAAASTLANNAGDATDVTDPFAYSTDANVAPNAWVQQYDPGVLDTIATALGITKADLLKYGPAVVGGLVGLTGNKPGAITSTNTTSVLPGTQPYIDQMLEALKTQYIGSMTNLPQLTDYTPTLTDQYIQAAIAGAIQPNTDAFLERVLPRITGGAIQAGQTGSSRQMLQNVVGARELTRANDAIGAQMWQNFAPLQAQDKQAAVASRNANQTTLWNAPQTATSNATNNLMTIASGGKTTTSNTQLPTTPAWQSALGTALTTAGAYNKIFNT